MCLILLSWIDEATNNDNATSITVTVETTEEITSLHSATTIEAATTTTPTNTSTNCFGVELTTASYGAENSWSLGSCSSAQTYGDDNDYIEQCCLVPGSYTLTCMDSYGDGWHGGFIVIQGQTYCEYFNSGSSATEEVIIQTGKYINMHRLQYSNFVDIIVYWLSLHVFDTTYLNRWSNKQWKCDINYCHSWNHRGDYFIRIGYNNRSCNNRDTHKHKHKLFWCNVDNSGLRIGNQLVVGYLFKCNGVWR